MSSRRFPGVELTDWRSRLVDRYERLFPDATPHVGPGGPCGYATGWPAVEVGWRDVVERLCRRLDAVTERSAGAVASGCPFRRGCPLIWPRHAEKLKASHDRMTTTSILTIAASMIGISLKTTHTIRTPRSSLFSCRR